MATNDQLYGSHNGPASESDPPTGQGFVKDFAYTLGWQGRAGWPILPGTVADDIMGCFTPEALPVLSGLAKGYAVCDHWFAPGRTRPNRAVRGPGRRGTWTTSPQVTTGDVDDEGARPTSRPCTLGRVRPNIFHNFMGYALKL